MVGRCRCKGAQRSAISRSIDPEADEPGSPTEELRGRRPNPEIRPLGMSQGRARRLSEHQAHCQGGSNHLLIVLIAEHTPGSVAAEPSFTDRVIGPVAEKDAPLAAKSVEVRGTGFGALPLLHSVM